MDSQTLLTFEQFLKWQQQQPGLAGANTLNRVDFDHDKFQRRKKNFTAQCASEERRSWRRQDLSESQSEHRAEWNEFFTSWETFFFVDSCSSGSLIRQSRAPAHKILHSKHEFPIFIFFSLTHSSSTSSIFFRLFTSRRLECCVHHSRALLRGERVLLSISPSSSDQSHFEAEYYGRNEELDSTPYTQISPNCNLKNRFSAFPPFRRRCW